MRYLDVFTPDSIIAAAVPYGNEDPREAGYNNAAYALDRDDVHLLASVENKKVYYIAAASEDFSAHLNAVTPLAAALPGMKGHQGDGAYLAISESGYAVVVRKGDELFSYVGDRSSVDAFIASHDVPTFSANDAAALPWEGFRTGIVRRAERVARSTILMGSAICIVSIALWLVFATWMKNLDDNIQATKDEASRSIKTSVQQLREFQSQPVIGDIYKMQDVIAITTNADKDAMVSYFKKDKEEVSWKAELPAWITSDYIDRNYNKEGRQLNVKRDAERNVIIVELPSTKKTQ
jgi:hypothetical protein